MRLGILGGTFDPVHYAHLLVAESCREQLALDEVWFLPAAVPPHKQQRELADAAHRAEMLELAIAGNERFRVCHAELDRGGVSYTVDTLEQLKAEYPARQMFLLMGADALADLPNWKLPARICELAMPVVVDRASGEHAEGGLDWSGLARLVSAERLAEMRGLQVDVPRLDLSSSDLRRRVAGGLSIRYRTPRAVERYMETHGLYR